MSDESKALNRIAIALEKQVEQNEELLKVNRTLTNLRLLEAGCLIAAGKSITAVQLSAYGKPEFPSKEEREGWQKEEKPLVEAHYDFLNRAASLLRGLAEAYAGVDSE